MPSGSFGTDQDDVEAAAATSGARSISRAARHRTGVERRDLAHVVVRGAHEPGGLHVVADQHAGAVDAVVGQPGPVLGEVGAHRADEQRGVTEHTQGERDVAGRLHRA